MESGFRLQSGICVGEVSTGTMTREGARISGWARLLPGASGPVTVVVFANGAAIARLQGDAVDADGRFAFTQDLPVESFRPPLMIDFSVFALDASGAGAQLPATGTAADLLRIQIGSRPDFLRAIQSPTERLRDPQILFYTSLHGLSRFRDDFAARSAAICTMGYRMNEGLEVPPAARQAFWEEVETLLGSTPDVPRGLWLRWHTSVRLIAGYAAYRQGSEALAAEHFSRVADFAFELNHWPTALTNVLIGIFLSGWTRYGRREWAEASREWRRAEGVLRLGASIAQFQNYYGFGELQNAVKVAQECFVGVQQAERQGAPINDTRLVMADYQVDVRHLPGVAFNLGVL